MGQEVDDWAYELFIAQANILEDEEFDVQVIVKKDRQGFVRRQERVELSLCVCDTCAALNTVCLRQHLRYTLILVVGSILGFWGISMALGQI